MAKLLKLRRGTTTQHGSFTGAEGELTIDTTKDTAVVHDGAQAGGRPLLREDMSNLPAGTIDNADVNASAAISGTKISPDFGTQDITTTGKVLFSNLYPTEGSLPSASTYHGMFAHVHDTGLAYFAHGGNWIKLAPLDAPDFTGGIDVTGDITSTQSVRANGSLYLNNVDGSVYFGSNTGGYGDNAGIGIASGNNYHITGSGQGDLVVSAKTGKRIVFGTEQSGGGGATEKRAVIKSDGTFDITGNLDVGAGVDVTGSISVTGTVDGRDVATDGTKLDGIESGATADQTKADIDALSINADTVDSLHAASFLRSDTSDTASGTITFSNGAGAVTIHGGSDIKLNDGTWTGNNTGAKIQGHSNSLYLVYPDAGACHIRDDAGNNNFTVDSSGNCTAVGNVTAYSDARLKTDISTINDALSIVGKLRGVSYKWIATDKPSIGVIAQEVEEVIPEVVLTNRDTNPSTGETTEIKSVDYGKIVGVLINAINELKAEVDTLKKPKRKGGK